jgi:hypothetical protein
MSWAARRRLLYILGLIVFFGILIGVPLAYKISNIKPTCTDGKMNQGESAPDKGGPCPDLDERMLSAVSPIWTRSFRVKDGTYTSATYIQNSNENAGATDVSYIFKLYDTDNILITERTGKTYIMPGNITPVVETGIDTGNMIVAHTFFEFASPIKWKKYEDISKVITTQGRTVRDADTIPRVGAEAVNSSVSPISDITFAGIVFDVNGNAIAASLTHIERLEPNEAQEVVFTWPTPFATRVGRVDIIPVLPPKPAWPR